MMRKIKKFIDARDFLQCGESSVLDTASLEKSAVAAFWIKLMLISMVLIVFMMPRVSCAAASPLPMLEQTANQIITTLETNRASLKGNPKIVYQAINRYLLPQVDLTGMSRSVLGRQAWNRASASEKAAFTHAFTELVVRTYAAPLVEYAGERVTFLPQRAGLHDEVFMRVNSVIDRPNGQHIPLSYSLVYKQGQWKIYDLSVEGVSLLQSFRSQFAAVLQNSNMHELIERMNQQKKVH